MLGFIESAFDLMKPCDGEVDLEVGSERVSSIAALDEMMDFTMSN